MDKWKHCVKSWLNDFSPGKRERGLVEVDPAWDHPFWLWGKLTRRSLYLAGKVAAELESIVVIWFSDKNLGASDQNNFGKSWNIFGFIAPFSWTWTWWDGVLGLGYNLTVKIMFGNICWLWHSLFSVQFQVRHWNWHVCRRVNIITSGELELNQATKSQYLQKKHPKKIPKLPAEKKHPKKM